MESILEVKRENTYETKQKYKYIIFNREEKTKKTEYYKNK